MTASARLSCTTTTPGVGCALDSRAGIRNLGDGRNISGVAGEDANESMRDGREVDGLGGSKTRIGIGAEVVAVDKEGKRAARP